MAALLLGAAALANAAGCDSAPPTGSVEMGPKNGPNAVQPGAPPKTDAPAKPGGEGVRSIKERPGATQ